MSYNDERNKPSGKSSQTFYCKHPWEAKHIAGVGHKKQHEFAAHPGISRIEDFRGSYNHDYHGKFVISGRPSAVNEVMIKMSDWLKECQTMHIENRFGRY